MPKLEPIDLAVHRAKVSVHRALRWIDDRREPLRPARVSRLLVDRPRVAEDRGALWNRDVEAREWPLELGKVENLRLAARLLDGLEFEAGQVFSFWAQVGPPVRLRGFVAGRELREGCVMPGTGGGLCLLSNGLYAVALRAGFRVLERHPHSRRPSGSRAAFGEDATVAWNYVDLRFAADTPWRLEVELDAEALIVAVRTERRRRSIPVVHERRAAERERSSKGPGARERPGERPGAREHERSGWSGDAGPSCRSCEQPCAYAHPPTISRLGPGRRTWLLDGVWPEYADYLRTHARADDRLATPIDGGRLGLARYAWPAIPGAEALHFPLQTAARSLRSRSLASQGAARQRALLADERRLAAAMAAQLTPADTELVVAQNLLPHLRRLGALGGRRVTVLMQRLPLLELHARLDEAHARYPHSPTLADFRAEPRLVEDEARALDAAVEIVTPHAEVAGCFAGKLTTLNWALPQARAGERERERERDGAPLRLWLPTSTAARKGVHELREVLRGLPTRRLWIAGGELEGPRFWPPSVTIERGVPDWAQIDAVVLPAWVEHQPRALLEAVAAGVPVIASRACGLDGVAGVRTVATGDVDELREAIVALC
jgi:hypothetical protein